MCQLNKNHSINWWFRKALFCNNVTFMNSFICNSMHFKISNIYELKEGWNKKERDILKEIAESHSNRAGREGEAF